MKAYVQAVRQITFKTAIAYEGIRGEKTEKWTFESNILS